MGGSKSEEFLAQGRRSARTPTCAAPLCDYAANVEAVEVPAPAPVAYDDAPAAHAEQTPDTPTIETLVDHLNEKFPRADRPWAAGDTLKNVVLSVLKHPDGTREPLAIGLPGDREVDQKRLEAQLEPTEFEPIGEAEFARYPALAKGYIGPARWARRTPARHPLPARPARGRGHPLGDRRRRRTAATCSTSWPAATSPPTARSRPRRSATATPAPTARPGHARSRRAASRWATSSSSAASTPTRSGLQVLDENGKLVTVTMGSYGIGASRAVAAIAEGTLDELGLVWPRDVAPADVHLVATGKDDGDLRGR